MRQNLILTIFLAALLAGCKPEATDYRQAAIEQYIIRQTGSDAKVSFDLFEVIDSTTYAAELDSLAGVIAPYATDIAYYDCHFSGRVLPGYLDLVKSSEDE